VPAPTAAEGGAQTLDPIAVLPIEDDQLFRGERAELRAELARVITARVPERRMLPVSEVDARLRPVTKRGVRCAYESVDARREASEAGWLSTELIQVSSTRGERTELWVDLSRFAKSEIVLKSAWDEQLSLMQRYRTAFANLVRARDASLLLAGLSASGSRANRVSVSSKLGRLTLCEGRAFHA
jgi:hypothetical protein